LKKKSGDSKMYPSNGCYFCYFPIVAGFFFLPSSFKLIPLQPTLPNALITYNLLLKIELNKLMPTSNWRFLVQYILQMWKLWIFLLHIEQDIIFFKSVAHIWAIFLVMENYPPQFWIRACWFFFKCNWQGLIYLAEKIKLFSFR